LGDRLPLSFVDEQKRKRIIRAFAGLVLKQGYEATKISDIVKRAGVARKTLYDNFEGKDALAEALIAKRCPNGFDFDMNDGLTILAIDLAARMEVSGRSAALGEIEGAREMLHALPGSLPKELGEPSDENLVCSLPPGRHGLPREFVHSNQRHRLLLGAALAIAERGYNATTVANITKAASVSRRTFYEHFDDKWAVGQALASESASSMPALVSWSGLSIFAVEVIAAGVTSEVGAARKVQVAELFLKAFAESLGEKRLAVAA